MSTTRVIHVDDIPNHPDAIYIGRPNPRRGLKGSRWANPYKIGDRKLYSTGVLTREDVIRRYQADLLTGPKRHQLADLPQLRGRTLVCWCRRDGEISTADNACHGDVLVDLLDRYTDDELRAMAEGSHA